MASSPGPEHDERALELDQGDDRRHRALGAPYADVEPAILPMGPDGTPVVGFLGKPSPLPTADPRQFVCLRGCRHLWTMVLHFDAGNPEATWDPEHGIRDVMTCTTCKGRRGMMVAPLLHLEGQGQLACEYQPTQGIWQGTACRLIEGHAGAHHHAPHPPEPREIPCSRCGGKGYVPDPAGGPVKQPRRVVRSCLRQPGVDTDLNDTVVYECSEWDPVDPDAIFVSEREVRRRAYLAQHPELGSAPQE